MDENKANDRQDPAEPKRVEVAPKVEQQSAPVEVAPGVAEQVPVEDDSEK